MGEGLEEGVEGSEWGGLGEGLRGMAGGGEEA